VAALIVATCLLAACNQQTVLNAFIPQQQAGEARHLLDEIRAGNTSDVVPRTDTEYFGKNPAALLIQIQKYFPSEQPKSVKIIDSSVSTSGGQTQYGFRFEYEFSHAWVIAEIVFVQKGGQITIMGMHVLRMPQSLEQLNAFNLTNKTPFEYAVLALAIFTSCFILFSAVMAFGSYIPRRKWLWIIFILLGFGQLSVNWTTGAASYSILSFELFGAMAASKFYGPWIISFGVPLGAILFWRRRNVWRSMKADSQAATPGNETISSG
jgi:hypothetical protein